MIEAVLRTTLKVSELTLRASVSVGRSCWGQVQLTEKIWLRHLDQRMKLALPVGGESHGPDATELLASLLATGAHQSTADGHEAYLRAVASGLVPDEARILVALTHRGEFALVHVESRRVGAGSRRVLTNATLLAAKAGLSVPDLAPTYVSRLILLGLATEEPERDSLVEEYEILGATRAVRDAMDEVSIGAVPGRVIKRTLVLSAVGQRLCVTGDEI